MNFLYQAWIFIYLLSKLFFDFDLLQQQKWKKKWLILQMCFIHFNSSFYNTQNWSTNKREKKSKTLWNNINTLESACIYNTAPVSISHLKNWKWKKKFRFFFVNKRVWYFLFRFVFFCAVDNMNRLIRRKQTQLDARSAKMIGLFFGLEYYVWIVLFLISQKQISQASTLLDQIHTPEFVGARRQKNYLKIKTRVNYFDFKRNHLSTFKI